MPELPEVETVCRGLERALVGDQIVAVHVLRPLSIEHPSAKQFAKKLPGHQFVTFQRRGKYILIGLSGGAGLAVHLRMSGRMLVVSADWPDERFLRVKIKLKSGRELRFEDMRVFGRLWFKESDQTWADVIPTLGELGMEPLTGLTGKHLHGLFQNKTQTIKSALLDQRLIAGIGNIYADESLFRARVHPQIAAGKVSLQACNILADEIASVLLQAIELGGSSVRDYKDASGVNGRYQHTAAVYGREGKPCHICGTSIVRVKIVGRSSHFCATCQIKSTRKR